MYQKFFKPFFDFIIALLGAIILSPIFILLIVLIKLESKGPVLFKQNRIGKDKKIFKIWKFRTMKIETPKDVPTHMLENPDQYITKVGRFLRKTSLDELPQIFNILALKMSIIGPRPALWNQDDLIAERDKYNANSIRPGLTGWAQINGRDELPIEIKAKFDGEYIEKMSFFFDIKVFFKTIKSVLKSEGVKEGKTDNSIIPETKDNQKENTTVNAQEKKDNNEINIDKTEKETINDIKINDVKKENADDNKINNDKIENIVEIKNNDIENVLNDKKIDINNLESKDIKDKNITEKEKITNNSRNISSTKNNIENKNLNENKESNVNKISKVKVCK